MSGEQEAFGELFWESSRRLLNSSVCISIMFLHPCIRLFFQTILGHPLNPGLASAESYEKSDRLAKILMQRGRSEVDYVLDMRAPKSRREEAAGTYPYRLPTTILFLSHPPIKICSRSDWSDWSDRLIHTYRQWEAARY